MIDSRTLIGIHNDYDLILLTVSDKAITVVAERVSQILKDYQGVVAHTAGSVSMEILAPFFKNYGVFYPLQTFSKDIGISDYREIPVFIEGNDHRNTCVLKDIARKIFDAVYDYSSVKRKKLHLASVFACNFSNAMFSIAEDILSKENIPFPVLHALIRMTAMKVMTDSPYCSQTGPARRGDHETLNEHIQDLSSYPELQSIYRLVSSYIENKYRQNEQHRL